MRLNIAICDDELNQIEYTKSITEKWAESHGHILDIFEYPSAEAFLFEYGERRFDILLLDIEMSKMNGIELARKLRETDRELQIIFITGYSDFISEGYDVSALHYLMKPVSAEKLCDVLCRAADNLKKAPEKIIINIGGSPIFLDKHDILYAEASSHNMIIYTDNDEYSVRMTVSQLEEKLGNGFFRCSRSFLVSLEHIARITKSVVILEGGRELPLGKGLYNAINIAVMKSFGR